MRVQAPVLAARVLKGTIAVERCRRLSDQGQHRDPAGQRLPEARHGVQAAAAGRRRHHTDPGAAATVAICHCGSGEFMFGQHRGDVVAEVRRIVEILDVGAVHTEDVRDPVRGQLTDDVVHHPVRLAHVPPTSVLCQ